MTDRPILFSAPMIRALLDGRKTQTRRIIKDAPSSTDGRWSCDPVRPTGWRWVGMHGYPTMPCVLRFAKGDRLWVRERFRGATGYDKDPPSKWGNKPIWYDADGTADEKLWWHLSKRSRPGIHMPRWASRLTLAVTDVRVQRLHDISDEDARAEGVAAESAHGPVGLYALLWETINGDGSWKANPWVIAVSFTVEQRNIDQ